MTVHRTWHSRYRDIKLEQDIGTLSLAAARTCGEKMMDIEVVDRSGVEKIRYN
jgi:hypothetical protein